MPKYTIQEVIGKFILKERKKQKLSLRKLSLKVYNNEASTTRLSEIERGITKDCSINTYHLIFTALGYDMRDLFK